MLEEVAREVYERLAKERDGRILAVWKDGSITVEGFGYRGKRTPDGIIEPVVTYPAKAPMSYEEVLERLERGLERRGLLPPAEGSERRRRRRY